MILANFTKGRTYQRGISLIEAMVAMLILAVLFLGIAQVLARGLVSQRYMNTQNLALLEMRERLQQSSETNLCTSPGSLNWVGSVSLTASCNESEVTISAGGISVPVTAYSITLSTTENDTSTELFGGDGVIRISDG
ncbi:prepilin-type N-terminal cleavage/methylation domain-containing protein [Pseudoalteromonas haloplanktis]|uniref:Prepilin-type N-terminal cleavage/methylation domain-containing protein n=1 Tax=Pseudoalteromonas haloplanktis TaxID=228 RepID=A0ABU1BCM9_PSEHA|nr:prepilin-type N-terminal cleavage/methylation domain-containing protein [Pseudoalteromonas haloplanktis]MDQ9092141.1 prepilin-type N-terminal cleavage/methylation domain-containing protein [Pseudoalteromonas haloplanktis]